VQNKVKSYTLINKSGLVCFKKKIYGNSQLVLAIPQKLKNEVIQNVHDNKISSAY